MPMRHLRTKKQVIEGQLEERNDFITRPVMPNDRRLVLIQAVQHAAVTRRKGLALKYVERRKACQPRVRLLVDGLLDALLPQICVVCGLDRARTGLCNPCRGQLPWNPCACQRCALPLPDGPDPQCGACLARPPPFDAAIAPLLFHFPVNRLVHAFKFKRNLACGRVLSQLLSERLGQGCVPEPALLVPVPMHRLRLALRGLNPAYEVACRCSRELALPLAAHALQRHRRTRPQTGLDATHRRRNLRGAFRWRGPPLAGLHVALVDDVMTTGSTVAECCRVLKRAGAAQVSVWVLARAVHH